MFVLAKRNGTTTVERYLYADMSIVSAEVLEGYNGRTTYTIVSVADMARAEVLRDRLQSGMIGGSIWETVEAAQAEIDSWK